MIALPVTLDFIDDIEAGSVEERRRAMARRLADNVKGDLAAFLLAEKTLQVWGMSLTDYGVTKPSRLN